MSIMAFSCLCLLLGGGPFLMGGLETKVLVFQELFKPTMQVYLGITLAIKAARRFRFFEKHEKTVAAIMHRLTVGFALCFSLQLSYSYFSNSQMVQGLELLYLFSLLAYESHSLKAAALKSLELQPIASRRVIEKTLDRKTSEEPFYSRLELQTAPSAGKTTNSKLACWESLV